MVQEFWRYTNVHDQLMAPLKSSTLIPEVYLITMMDWTMPQLSLTFASLCLTPHVHTTLSRLQLAHHPTATQLPLICSSRRHAANPLPLICWIYISPRDTLPPVVLPRLALSEDFAERTLVN